MRSREFNEEEVLEKAMKLFWEKGFQGTSVNDILQVTGLHKGNLYRTFGSKENLFQLALKKYGRCAYDSFIRDEDPLEYISDFFKSKISKAVSIKRIPACLIMNSCIEFGHSKTESSEISNGFMCEIEENLRESVRRAKKNGQLDSSLNIDKISHRLLGAAFAITEMSKFRKDVELFRNIANGVLEELNIQI